MKRSFSKVERDSDSEWEDNDKNDVDSDESEDDDDIYDENVEEKNIPKEKREGKKKGKMVKKEKETKIEKVERVIGSSSSSPLSPLMNTLEVPKSAHKFHKNMKLYDTFYANSIEEAKMKLEEDGVVVIKGVLSKEEIENGVQGVWDVVGELTKNMEKPVDRNDPESYRSFFELRVMHGMLMQHFGIGHAQVSWDIRQNPKVVKVFSEIWKTKMEDMLVSFDGMAFSLPPEFTNRGYYRGNDWLHFDQGSSKLGKQCFQGMVTLKDVNDGDAALRCVPKSHKLHTEFWKHFDVTSKGDWYKLDERESKWFLEEKKLSLKLVKAKAGDLILWDSRLLHCGSEPLRTREKPNERMVIYVSMLPRSLATKKDLEKKRAAFEKKRTTSHWANGARLFPEKPRTYGNDISFIEKLSEPPKLTTLGRRLAGFDK